MSIQPAPPNEIVGKPFLANPLKTLRTIARQAPSAGVSAALAFPQLGSLRPMDFSDSLNTSLQRTAFGCRSVLNR
jgi:hypothetical protein